MSESDCTIQIKLRQELAAVADRLCDRVSAEQKRREQDRLINESKVQSLQHELKLMRDEHEKIQNELLSEIEQRRKKEQLLSNVSTDTCDWLMSQWDPTEFEIASGSLCKCFGYSVTHTGKVADGGIDLMVSDQRGRKGVVQCKQYSLTNRVTESQCRDLFGVCSAKQCEFAVMITSGYLTRAALNWINEHKLSHVLDVWDRSTWQDCLSDPAFHARFLRQISQDLVAYHTDHLKRMHHETIAHLNECISDLRSDNEDLKRRKKQFHSKSDRSNDCTSNMSSVVGGEGSHTTPKPRWGRRSVRSHRKRQERVGIVVIGKSLCDDTTADDTKSGELSDSLLLDNNVEDVSDGGVSTNVDLLSTESETDEGDHKGNTDEQDVGENEGSHEASVLMSGLLSPIQPRSIAFSTAKKKCRAPRRVWTEHDDSVLGRLVDRFGEEWDSIMANSHMFDGRWSRSDIQKHWNRVLKPKLTRS